MINAIKRAHYAHVSSQMPPRIRLRTAYHEAGHGFFMSRSSLWKNIRLSINDSGGLTRGEYSGRSRFSDAEAGWLIIRMTLAGAATEQYFFGNYSRLGAAQDVANATELALGREAVLAEYIKERFLPTSAAAMQRAAVPGTSPEIQSILGGALLSVAAEVQQNAGAIRHLGKLLYKKSYLSDDELRKVLA